MNEYEISLHIENKKYVDVLMVALARQGYEVYLNEEEGVVCFKTYDDEVKQIER
jgi:hypothetical protein